MATSNDHRLAKIHFEHRPENEGQDHRGWFIVILPQKIADHTKDDHDKNFSGVIVDAVGTDQAEKQDQWHQNSVWDLQHLHPEADQRQV